MPIAKITSGGLAAIAVSVALLWGCLIGERTLAGRAYAERVQVLRDSRQMQNRPQTLPVSAPAPHRPNRTIVAEG
jgi:hypothetical protein